MIYLLSQMLMALLVAVILGAALGWLINRSSSNKKSRRLKKNIAHYKAQLAQAQSDVDMINNDYDEMQHQSRDQIAALTQENQQIPSLKSNLEKSQLLVRQMIQRHDASLRELTNERNKLLEKLSKDKHQKVMPAPVEPSATSIKPARHSSSKPSVKSYPAASLDESVLQSSQQKHSDANLSAEPSEELSAHDNSSSNASEDVEIDADATPYDEVIEIADTLQRELKLELNAETGLEAYADSSVQIGDLPMNEQTQSDTQVKNHIDTIEQNNVQMEAIENNSLHLRTGEKQPEGASEKNQIQQHSYRPEPAANKTMLSFSDNISPETSANDIYEEQDDSLNHAYQTKATAPDILLDNTASTDKAGSLEHNQIDIGQQTASLFGAVNQHDDLQQIFGIGPLTEKALNDLGITSYSQLAKLNEHDIQKIADALDIGSARIERDNWVGNARRQLEEVLEQL